MGLKLRRNGNFVLGGQITACLKSEKNALMLEKGII